MNKNNSPSKFTQLAALLDKRNKTERILIFVTLSLGLFMLVSLAVVSALSKNNAKTQANIQSAEAENIMLNQELLLLRKKLQDAPGEAAHQRLESLRNELKNTGQFSELMDDLISPREMVRFVDGVLSSNKGLLVVGARNLTAIQLWPEPITENSNSPETNTPDNTINTPQTESNKDTFTIYKHGLELEVKGGYRDLIAFFATLEQLPWNILWGDVILTSFEDDDSVARLMIYTLSPNKAWMGL